ncbi:MAG TPA: hypothetical protein VJT49_19920 [Amycolatopsis sp.]|uniref:hypothetical protein n=1 Tax=Amycolatopsis sp. TaxID=37632 RepID=UPI002B46D5B9|nr:hypothetical protein [Amycolatopsis sp.]HKS47333.1 hypothetical protein [Amycolatopsis sp.]
MLAQAITIYQDSPRATHWLGRHLERFEEPVRLAVVGPPRSGTTTLVQAIGDSPGELTVVDAPAPAPGTIEGTLSEADAVLHLVRHPHHAELDFLHTVQDHPIARAAAVNAIIVLSRADELGGGRVDGLISARRLARRYRREPQARGLCQDVVPVAGLLARAARTLTQADVDAFVELARVPRAQLEAHLLSVDRFAALSAGHAELLARFGMFGIRVTLPIVRRDVRTVEDLFAQLVPRSGLAELLESIEKNFTRRRSVLKARSALLGLEVVLRMEPRPAAAELASQLEQTLASAHDFRELRLLAAIHTGRVKLPEDLRAEAVRLTGGQGTGLAERLSEVDLRGAIQRWRHYAENPALGSAERRAATVVLRSCEAIASGTLR